MDLININYFPTILSILVLVFVIRQIGTFKGINFIKYITSPLITIAVACFVVLAISQNGVSLYTVFILAGLIFSLVADTLLMIEETDLMKYGIIYFLLAHVSYIIAFSGGYTFIIWNIIPMLVLVIFIAAFFMLVKGKTGGLDIPVLIYVIIISIMVFFAIGGMNSTVNSKVVLALSGAILFLISDLVIAINAFIKKIPYSSVIVWTIYAPAQFLIALSCF